jgi:peptide/nickel transport system permease protein
MKRFFFGSFATGFGTVCGILVIGFVIVAPFVSPLHPDQIDTLTRLAAPSWTHPLGTDDLGRDVLVRLAVGGRLSLVCAVAAVAISGFAGLVLGGVAGLAGSVVDTVLMRVADALQGYPQIMLAVIVAVALGRGMVPVTIALAVAYWPYFAKISRGLVRPLRSAQYVQAAVAQGANRAYLLRRHILPAVFPPLLTQMTMAVGEAIIAIAGLSLIGLGAQEPTPEWGAIISESASFILQAWWYPLFAGLPLFLASMSFNLLGDSLRENMGRWRAVARGGRSAATADAPAAMPPALDAVEQL